MTSLHPVPGRARRPAHVRIETGAPRGSLTMAAMAHDGLCLVALPSDFAQRPSHQKTALLRSTLLNHLRYRGSALRYFFVALKAFWLVDEQGQQQRLGLEVAELLNEAGWP